jgi:hypothetical protein
VSFGRADGLIDVYDPTDLRWTAQPASGGPASLADTVAIRLGDGSVLVLGGATPTTAAFVFRPSLVGPNAGTSIAEPNGGGGTSALTAPDPSTWDPGFGRLTATAADLDARALVGGTRTQLGKVSATVATLVGGVALIAQQTSPSDGLVARVVTGRPATLERLDGEVLCTGAMVGALGDVRLELQIDAGAATVRQDNLPLLHCALEGGARGAWGVAPLDDGEGGHFDVVTVRLDR